ncbi:hypothetical protein AMECASPLE_033213 [Ameca splendens]|uniref:Uncharacterized protein n=1 Tax=Ameca splendens TaxID=208324 RepID=A0ABV0YI49_9TELE
MVPISCLRSATSQPCLIGLLASPRDLGKALREVGVEYIPDRVVHQTFPAGPHYMLGPAESVQLPALEVNPTHHQVVIVRQLSPSLQPSVQDMRADVRRHTGVGQ